MLIEKRSFKTEFRVTEKDGKHLIEGYASVFETPSDSGGLAYFVETIHKGAFTEAIKYDDVRALKNHDENLVLGRNIANTLLLEEDAKGLRYVIEAPDTSYARDLIISMNRGDINQSSFAFVPRHWVEPNDRDGKKRKSDDCEKWDFGVTPVTRDVYCVKLYDVSPVTFPWYEDTTSNAKSSAQAVLANARKIYQQPLDDGINAAAARNRQIELLEKTSKF